VGKGGCLSATQHLLQSFGNVRSWVGSAVFLDAASIPGLSSTSSTLSVRTGLLGDRVFVILDISHSVNPLTPNGHQTNSMSFTRGL